MKIVIDLTSLAFNFSGVERYALNISKEILIQDQKNEYYLVFANEIDSRLQQFLDEIRVHGITLKSKNNKMGKLYLFQIALPNLINKIDPDCCLFPGFAAPILLKRKNMIDTIHDLGYFDCPQMWKWYISAYGKLKIRFSVRHTSIFVTVSDFTKERLIDLFHIDQERIYVVKNAVDSRFNEKFISIDEMQRVAQKYNLVGEEFILSLSTLEPRKNLKLLVTAYADLVCNKQIQKKLVLAGRKGWKIDDLLNGIDPEAKQNILFTGFIDDEDLPVIYKLADLFVFPSMYEGFGIPPLEAISCGTQTIVSDIDIFREVMGDSAIYFKNNSIADLKEKLLNNNYIDINELNRQSSLYGWDKSAQQYLIIINKQ